MDYISNYRHTQMLRVGVQTQVGLDVLGERVHHMTNQYLLQVISTSTPSIQLTELIYNNIPVTEEERRCIRVFDHLAALHAVSVGIVHVVQTIRPCTSGGRSIDGIHHKWQDMQLMIQQSGVGAVLDSPGGTCKLLQCIHNGDKSQVL